MDKKSYHGEQNQGYHVKENRKLIQKLVFKISLHFVWSHLSKKQTVRWGVHLCWCWYFRSKVGHTSSHSIMIQNHKYILHSLCILIDHRLFLRRAQESVLQRTQSQMSGVSCPLNLWIRSEFKIRVFTQRVALDILSVQKHSQFSQQPRK